MHSMPQAFTLGWVKHIHLIGIGGSGMSGIAEVLVNQGFTVTGSDIKQNHLIEHLQYLGVSIQIGHSSDNVSNCDVVVYSSAIAADNVELSMAHSLRKPVVRRAEMLSELMRFSHGIAIAGTHGKTTVTSLIACILQTANMDPTYVTGGLLKGGDSHARLGKGKYFVAEADESDTSFLHLTPTLSVVTNIDADHLENYQNDYQKLQEHFIEFVQRLPFYGTAVICSDPDAGVIDISEKFSRRIVSYGFSETADYCAHQLLQQGNCTRFSINRRGDKDWLELCLNMPGRHNVLNTLAAVAVTDTLSLPTVVIADAVDKFHGISRRSEVKGELSIAGKNCLLIDDYAHHPCELSAIFEATRSGWPGRRVVALYQPHRYTRLHALFDEFCIALTDPELLFVLDIYAAGEEPIAGVNSHALCHGIRMRANNAPLFINRQEDIFDLLEKLTDQDDILLILGAGDISSLANELVSRYGVDD